ncbi:hypothetical protein Hypma_004460 [Hypsizygus marmoreus]|uniref:Uncharacterized protein n=1 Tax=Hypsizygus marmoreus TaxID=39966 RepID=A0A369K3Y5_HYPMA|nr:hypothetical protein Hypma_004460 [Hypsizygus marmoreus]
MILVSIAGMDTSFIAAEDRVAVNLAATNNDVLPDRLHNVAQRMIAESERYVAWHDVEISRVERLLEALQKQRSVYVTRVQRYKSTVASYRKIPNELIAEIFMHSSEYLYVIPKLNQTPWTLERVCSRWRAVAHATPKLWSTIRVRKSWSDNTLTRHITALKGLAWRSTGTLISLDVDVARSKEVVPFVTLLRKNAKRFDHISLTVDHTLARRFLASPPCLFYNLQTLSIKQSSNDQLKILSVLQGAHNLRSLTFHFPLPLDTLELSKIPFSQLTTLSLQSNGLPSAVLFEALAACKLLVVCALEISIITRHNRNIPNPTRLTLPELERLRLDIARGTQNADDLWIADLNLPKLRDFEFHAMGSESLQWRSAWSPTITRSRRLECLMLFNEVSEDVLEEILVATPFLIKLEMWCGTKFSNSMLRRMSSGELLPRLSSLSCVIETEEHLNLHLDMFDGRRLESNSAVEITYVHFSTAAAMGSIPLEKLIEVSKKYGVHFPGYV